jgi:PAS domain S-box-containing protein
MNKGRWEGEYRFRNFRTNQPIVVHHNCFLIADSRTNEAIAIATVTRDITERKRAQEELQNSYNLLQSVINSIPDAIVVKDRQSRYVMINAAVTDIHGKPESEILGRDDSELFPPEMALLIMGNDRRIISTGETEILEEDILIKGTQKTYLSTKSVWRDAQGNAIGLILIARDITDRKRAEQEIRELNQNLERRVAERTAELEAINQELESFSYSVSHDLRAPLRGIDGFSQALLDRYADQLDEKGKHYLRRIRTGTQRMGELIDDLLKLSRVTRSEMQPTQVDLSALAREIAAELQRTQPDRQVEWAIAPGRVAHGDSRLLRIVLENLLNNSWKFTSARMLARIEFDTKLQEDAKTVYFVKDNGAGFEMAYANKLFGAFQRLHSQAQFPGTGIGLATVQRIIHRHGGRVWAEAAVEQGATFYFTL